jgi:hypothetical protein
MKSGGRPRRRGAAALIGAGPTDRDQISAEHETGGPTRQVSFISADHELNAATTEELTVDNPAMHP